LRDILERLRRRELTVDEAEKQIRLLAIEEVENVANIDVGRHQRRGFPEVILAEGKTVEMVASILERALAKAEIVLVSRLGEADAKLLRQVIPMSGVASYDSASRLLVVRRKEYAVSQVHSRVGILTGGTSDIPVAAEAEIILRELGCDVIKAVDVGIAGLHRILKPLKDMVAADVDVLVVVAGREGALPGVVAGLVDVPVIAVPTSVGYGHGGNGEAALAAMLQACSLGITVVNIDAGLAAGIAAYLIARRIGKFRLEITALGRTGVEA
jgi:hypothetical protein